MAGARRLEMGNAAAVLGIQQRWLGFVDSGLPEGDPLPPLPPGGCFALQPLERATAPLVRLVRNFKPHVILSYDENGGYPHPDHIMAHKVAVEAFEAAGDPPRALSRHGRALGGPASSTTTAPSARTIPCAALRLGRSGAAVPPVCRAACGMAGSDAEGHTAPVAGGHQTTTQVDCGDFFEARDDACGPTGPRSIPPSASSSRYRRTCKGPPGRGRTTLIKSRVLSELPEKDLFAGGIR